MSAVAGNHVSTRGASFCLGGDTRSSGPGRSHPHVQRLALAITASLAFYATLPWLDLFPRLVADTLILGLWSLPALCFLAAFYPSPLFMQIPARLAAIRITMLTIVSFACSLSLMFLVNWLLKLLNALAGVPMRVV